MSVELFWINGSASGGVVTISWNENQTPGFPAATSFQLQRKPFGYGQDQWANVGSAIAVVAGTTSWSTTDTPPTGDWSYRIQATVTQGGVDSAGTQLSSIEINVTTIATTSALALALGSKPAGDPAGYTQMILGWTLTPSTADVIHYVVQRSLNGGSYKNVAELDEFETNTWSEILPNGIGAVSYQVYARLPNSPSVSQYQGNSAYGAGSIITTSNTVSQTI